MTGYTVVIDPHCVTETGWRADWERYWGMATTLGYTEVLTDEAGAVRVLRADADCKASFGEGAARLQIDLREGLERLAFIGAFRGWLTDDADEHDLGGEG